MHANTLMYMMFLSVAVNYAAHELIVQENVSVARTRKFNRRTYLYLRQGQLVQNEA